MPTLYQIILVALAASFIILFATKTEIRYSARDFCDSKKLSIIAEMLDCDLCLSFWMSLIVSIIFTLVTKDVQFIFASLFAAPIARFLL